MFRTLIRSADRQLLTVTIIIFMVGMLAIASATNVLDTGFNRILQIQLASFFLGLVVMYLVMAIDYNTFGDFYRLIYAISIFALLLVYIPGLGITLNGARCWIHLGIVDFQTSELAKIGYIIVLAKYLENPQNQLDTLRDLVMPVIMLVPFLILLLKQPDLGISLIFIFVTAGMMFVAGMNGRLFCGLACASVAMMPVAYFLMKPHQRVRIDAFLHPDNLKLAGNYHVYHFKIAIGSGQLFGRGIFQGVFHRSYLPEPQSDSIFGVIGEETGFVGGVILIGLYYWFLSRMLEISKFSRDRFGQLVVTGITCMFTFQVFENLGMAMGVMPLTGVPLPFVSAGGTSVITNMMALGLVHNVYMRRRRSGFTA